MITVIDNKDGYLLAHKWHVITSSSKDLQYVGRTVPPSERVEGEPITILMHREILKAPKGVHVDHVDGDGLNNLRSNLRLADYQQNKRNSRIPKNNTSGVKGVHWHSRDRKWVARIKIDYVYYHLGKFDNIADAAAVRLAAEKEHFGEFRRVVDTE